MRERAAEPPGAVPGRPEGEGAPASGRPLVVVTRPRDRAPGMIAALRERGIDSIHLPTLEVVGPEDPEPLERAAAAAATWDWIVFTSTAGVRAFTRAGPILPAGDRPGEDGPRVAAVGPATAAAVVDLLGREVDLAPGEEYSAEGLLRAFRSSADVRGRRILLPLAEAAADTLPVGLEGLGARVERVVAYRTVPPEPEPVEALRRALSGGRIDLLTFTSPSTAENFLAAVGEEALRVPAAVIGTVTAAAAEGLGYTVAAVAREQTVDGLVRVVAEHLGRGEPADGSGP
ncbi:MAG: uroporphyrinogen-III synthase [Gemmatimonadota bacterium]